jgi:uncharacterized SAM-binding protein YcdF (DUF218 family)
MSKYKNILIVLGCTQRKDGKPSDCMLARVRKALNLWKKDNYSKLLLSGGASRYGVPEAAVMRVMLLNFIPHEKILVEHKSRGLVQKALFCWSLLKDKDVKHITVVTSEYQLKRAKYIFKKMYAHMGVSLSFETVEDTFDPVESLYLRIKEEVLMLKVRVFGFG